MKYFTVFALLFTCVCSNPLNNSGRITSAQNATRNQFPYQVRVEWGTPASYICGGTIISPLYVVTAGQCVTELPPYGTTRVVAGILNLNTDVGVIRDVNSSLAHPLFTGGIGPYDIALLQLESPLPFSESIQPIALPRAGLEPNENQPAILSGWGSTETPITNYPSILQYAQVSVLSYNSCAAALLDVFGEVEPLNEATNICSGPLYNGVGTCRGDYGSPLVQIGPSNQTELIGVVSWLFSRCGYPGVPSIYTKVSSVVDFIEANVPDLIDTYSYLNNK